MDLRNDSENRITFIMRTLKNSLDRRLLWSNDRIPRPKVMAIVSLQTFWWLVGVFGAMENSGCLGCSILKNAKLGNSRICGRRIAVLESIRGLLKWSRKLSKLPRSSLGQSTWNLLALKRKHKDLAHPAWFEVGLVVWEGPHIPLFSGNSHFACFTGTININRGAGSHFDHTLILVARLDGVEGLGVSQWHWSSLAVIDHNN